jgi:hypothetical protein
VTDEPTLPERYDQLLRQGRDVPPAWHVYARDLRSSLRYLGAIAADPKYDHMEDWEFLVILDALLERHRARGGAR